MSNLPSPLETPPRTTGNAQQDLPILIDWFWKAYQVIQQSVLYINDQVNQNPDLSLNNLPDPATSTIATAQETANAAYTIADTQKNRIDNLISGTFTISEAATSSSPSFPQPQKDSAYRVFVQAISSTGSPALGSFIIAGKSYNTNGFTATLAAAPGAGASVTFEWQLIRNT